MRYLHLQLYDNREIQECKLIGIIPMKGDLPHFCVSLTVLTKYGLSACLPGTPAIWKNFDQALPIASFAFLPFCVHEPVSNPWLRHSSSPTSCQVIVLHHRTLLLRSGPSKHPLHSIPPRRTTTPSTLICTSSLFHPPSELCFRSQ